MFREEKLHLAELNVIISGLGLFELVISGNLKDSKNLLSFTRIKVKHLRTDYEGRDFA